MKYKYIEKESTDHVQHLIDTELNDKVLKIGSMLSILINSKINQTKLLVYILNDLEFRKCVMGILEIDDFFYLIRFLLNIYPSLGKSKIITYHLKTLKNE